MTIASSSRKVRFNGSGSNGPFSFTDKLLATTDILVSHIDADGVKTALVVTTDYTISLVANGVSGATITLTAGSFPSGLPVGEKLLVEGLTPLTQATPYRNLGSFDPAKHENSYDKVTMALQEHKASLNLCLSVPPEDLIEDPSLNLVLPNAADRAGKIIVFDVDGGISLTSEIPMSGLAAMTASRAVVTDASGYLTTIATTSTELGYVNGVTSAIQTQLDGKQPLDADLTALAALNTTGMMARTAANTYTMRTITGTANEITVTNGDGVSGNPTLSLATGIDPAKLADGSVSATEFQYLNGVTSALQTQLDAKQGLDSTLTALAAYNTNGIITQTAADTFTGRTITGTADKITVTNGDGVAGNPTLTIAATYAGQNTITTLGTIATGVWQGTAVADSYIASAATWNSKQAGDATLTALAAYNTNGLLTQTAADTFTGRTVTGTANEISVADGDGVAGNPTLSLPATIDLGGKTSFEIPNSAAPTVDADGEIALDTTVTDYAGGFIKYYSNATVFGVVAMPLANFSSPTDGHLVTYDAATDSFKLAAVSGLGLGDFSGPGTATDNAIVRFDGTTGKLGQNSGVIIDDTNNVTGMASLTLTNTGLHLLDTNASHDLIVAPGSDLTADRTLTLTTGDADRTLTISGNTTLSGGTHSGTNTGDQTVTGTTNRISVSGGGGATPTVDIAATYVGQNTITTLGTVTTGTWNATAIGATYGGTGQTTATQGDILYASAANTWSKLAAGTSGHYLKTQGAGANPIWAAITQGAADIQTFTSSGTWTKPSTGTWAIILGGGAGGAGGCSNSASHGGGGGGGGYGGWYMVPLAMLSGTETVTLGDGGTGSAVGNTVGADGGNTTFGTKFTFYGGGGGGAATTTKGGGGGGGKDAKGYGGAWSKTTGVTAAFASICGRIYTSLNDANSVSGGYGGGPSGGQPAYADTTPTTYSRISAGPYGGGCGGIVDGSSNTSGAAQTAYTEAEAVTTWGGLADGDGGYGHHGGGGGGGGGTTTVTGGAGGSSIHGGGGGGGGAGDSAPGPSYGGLSKTGGAGGRGGYDTTAGTNGSQATYWGGGGGGGGSETGTTSGNGGKGHLVVIVI